MNLPYNGHVMFISPHPDDEVISSGFLLMNLIKYRNSVHIHYLTSGSDPEMMPVREQEATKVSKKIGTRCFFHGLDPHGDILKPALEFARLLMEKAPDLVIMPCRTDPHPTHRFAYDVIVLAMNLSLYTGDILQYSVWEPIQDPDYSLPFDSSMFEKKLSLLKLYRSQMENHDFESWVSSMDKYQWIMLEEMLKGRQMEGSARKEVGELELKIQKEFEQERLLELKGIEHGYAEAFRQYPGVMEGPSVLCIGDVFLDILTGPIEKNTAEGSTSTSISHSLGGNAGNTAMALSRLGSSSALYAAMGEDWRADILECMMAEAGVRPFIIRKEEGKTAMTLALAYKDGSRHFISDFGSNLLFTEDDLPILEKTNLKPFNHVHRAGFFWLSGLRNGPNLRFLSSVREMGMSTSLDVGSPITEHEESGVWGKKDREEIRDLLPYVDIFFGNESEIIGVAGLSTQDRAADAVGTGFGEVETDQNHCQAEPVERVSNPVVDAAHALLERGTGMVVVHQGDRGATIVTEEEVLGHRAPDVRIENPTGAGDIFNAAFIDAYLRKLPLSECLAFAVAAGSLHVSSISNPYPTREEVITFMGSLIDHKSPGP